MESTEKETFKTRNYFWVKCPDGAAIRVDVGAIPRKFRNENTGNGLMVLRPTKNGLAREWRDDNNPIEPFDTECKQALRALIGPPPWETHAAAGSPATQVQPLVAPSHTTREAIQKTGDELVRLSNEAEHGFSKLRTIALRAVDDNERLADELQAWKSWAAQLTDAGTDAEMRTNIKIELDLFREKINQRPSSPQTQLLS